MTLAYECFLEHVKLPSFEDGVQRGYWGVTDIAWPYVIIWIGAAPRQNSPDRYYLRFWLESYPALGPTATLWDVDRCQKLDRSRWPKGTDCVKSVFRTDWYDCNALYAPWDRIAMYGDPANPQFGPHANWESEYPGMGWKNTHTIVHYLRPTHELLNSPQYHGS